MQGMRGKVHLLAIDLSIVALVSKVEDNVTTRPARNPGLNLSHPLSATDRQIDIRMHADILPKPISVEYSFDSEYNDSKMCMWAKSRNGAVMMREIGTVINYYTVRPPEHRDSWGREGNKAKEKVQAGDKLYRLE